MLAQLKQPSLIVISNHIQLECLTDLQTLSVTALFIYFAFQAFNI